MMWEEKIKKIGKIGSAKKGSQGVESLSHHNLVMVTVYPFNLSLPLLSNKNGTIWIYFKSY